MISFDFLQKIDRRNFLKIVSVTGISGLIYPAKLISSLLPPSSSKVVIIEDSSATNGYSINQNTVQVMIDAGIKMLTQQNDVGESWKTILPGITPASKIALKVNCLFSSMSTHPPVTYAVAESLKKMVFQNKAFPENNIIIYDNSNSKLSSAGYTINTSTTGIRCFGTNAAGIGYSSQRYTIHNNGQYLSRIVTEIVDYIINISVLKNHSISGVSFCLKNHYGTCSNPGALHGNHCDPYIPALNALAPIATRQKMNICDALFGVKSGGPDHFPQFVANKIIMSQDIVAADYWCRQLLKENGCTTTSSAHHIDTAASNYNLGNNDPAKMEVVNVTEPTTDVHLRENDRGQHPDAMLWQNYPNPFNNQTRIQFYVARSSAVAIIIFDVTGKQVRQLVNKSVVPGWHQVCWDGANDSGKQVTSGYYICQMKTDRYQKSFIMQIVR